MLKLFHRRDKRQAQLQAEEDGYFEALSWTDKARLKQDLIEKELHDLKKQRDVLRAVHEQHTTALVALDDVYASVFDGPSPDMPEEDVLEAAVQSVKEVLFSLFVALI